MFHNRARWHQYLQSSPETQPRAIERFKNALGELKRASRLSYNECHYWVLKAALARTAGKARRARRWLGRAERVAQQADSPWGEFEVLRERARLDLQRGDADGAAAQAKRARRLAARHGWAKRAEAVVAEFALPRAAEEPTEDKYLQATRSHTLRDSVLRRRVFDTLLETSLLSARAADPVSRVPEILDKIIAAFGAERGAIFLEKGIAGAEEVQICRDGEGNDLVELGQYSRTVVQTVRTTAQPAVISGAQEALHIGAQSAVLHHLRSIMATPLLLKNQLVGVLYLDNRLAKGVFSEEEVDFLVALANYIPIAFETSRAARLESERVALERSNRDLDSFAAVASHDLQEPLRKIQVFGAQLQEMYDGILDDTGRDYLRRMRSATERMESLITGLLEYSRVTARSRPFQRLALGDVLAGVLEDLELSIRDAGATIEVADLPQVDGDPLQLRQLFQNLVGNSLRYRRQDHPLTIRIRARLWATESHSRGGNGAGAAGPDATMCDFMVEDTGMGFDMKNVERIFGMFQRLHGRGALAGTGMGLAICRRIAEHHRGSIAAEAEVGRGAKFIVTIPTRQHEDPDDSGGRGGKP